MYCILAMAKKVGLCKLAEKCVLKPYQWEALLWLHRQELSSRKGGILGKYLRTRKVANLTQPHLFHL